MPSFSKIFFSRGRVEGISFVFLSVLEQFLKERSLFGSGFVTDERHTGLHCCLISL